MSRRAAARWWSAACSRPVPPSSRRRRASPTRCCPTPSCHRTACPGPGASGRPGAGPPPAAAGAAGRAVPGGGGRPCATAAFVTAVGAGIESGLVVIVATRGRTLVVAAVAVIAALVVATGGRGRPGPVGGLAARGPAGPRWVPRGRTPAVITRITPVPIVADSSAAAGPVGEFVGIFGAHVTHGHNDNDENYHDNDCQDDHELSHRTIQRAWPHRAVQARPTRPSTRAFPLREHPGSNPRLIT